MKVIIHDLTEEEFEKIYEKIPDNKEEKRKIISYSHKIKNCIGCFHCWVKTPGICRIKDGYENLGKLYSEAEEITIISKCCYGSYSPFVKNVLDRSIPYLLPFFKMKNFEMHHTVRYKNRLNLNVYFYGENITDEEKNTAQNLIEANKINLNARKCNLYFLQ